MQSGCFHPPVAPLSSLQLTALAGLNAEPAWGEEHSSQRGSRRAVYSPSPSLLANTNGLQQCANSPNGRPQSENEEKFTLPNLTSDALD